VSDIFIFNTSTFLLLFIAFYASTIVMVPARFAGLVFELVGLYYGELFIVRILCDNDASEGHVYLFCVSV